jgi:hypothetical protein
VVVALVIYLLQRNRKRLVYDELQNLSLFGLNTSIKDKVEIKYAGKVVSDLHLLTVKIKNSGNVSIRKNDVVSPIKISYKQEFIECSVIEKFTEGLDIKLNVPVDGKYAEIEFDLLNPRESFVLQFVSLNRLSDPKIEYRIDGLSRISYGSVLEDVFDVRRLWNLIIRRPIYKMFFSFCVVSASGLLLYGLIIFLPPSYLMYLFGFFIFLNFVWGLSKTF